MLDRLKLVTRDIGRIRYGPRIEACYQKQRLTDQYRGITVAHTMYRNSRMVNSYYSNCHETENIVLVQLGWLPLSMKKLGFKNNTSPAHA